MASFNAQNAAKGGCACATSRSPSIDIERGDGIMATVIYKSVQDLAFAHWQYNANERAYANKLITRAMYEFAREELRKSIDRLSKACYAMGQGR